MHTDLAMRMMGDLFWTGFLVSMPILGLTLIVGVLIGIVQVVTQVQEMSLSFVPKLIAAALTLVALGPWMMRKLTQFTAQLWTNIPLLVQ
ncbi:MAG: flagellar type III secretion system protein FliQ [Betaproteobacteria bacterium]|nr:flagellar type III secretion system protein FliQ [Betaproteobacteria bacterium]